MLYQVYIMLYLEHVVVEEVTVWKVWVPGHCYQIGAQVERDLHSSVKDSPKVVSLIRCYYVF